MIDRPDLAADDRYRTLEHRTAHLEELYLPYDLACCPSQP